MNNILCNIYVLQSPVFLQNLDLVWPSDSVHNMPDWQPGNRL